MKRYLIIVLTIILLGASWYLAQCGYHNYRLLQVSRIRSEHEVHLERMGSFSVTAPLSGRSMFRPGGVLEIFLGIDGMAFGEELAGKATVKVLDGNGVICLKDNFNNFSVGISSRGNFFPLPEFDASTSGPYTIQFEITEPFKVLTGIKQTLSVHYFICGEEPLLHFMQFGLSGLLLTVSALLTWKLIGSRK